MIQRKGGIDLSMVNKYYSLGQGTSCWYFNPAILQRYGLPTKLYMFNAHTLVSPEISDGHHHSQCHKHSQHL